MRGKLHLILHLIVRSPIWAIKHFSETPCRINQAERLHALHGYRYLRGLPKIAMVPVRYHGSNPDHIVDRCLSLPVALLTWQGPGISRSTETPSLLAVRSHSRQSTSLYIHRSAVQYSQVPLPLHDGHSALDSG